MEVVIITEKTQYPWGLHLEGFTITYSSHTYLPHVWESLSRKDRREHEWAQGTDHHLFLVHRGYAIPLENFSRANHLPAPWIGIAHDSYFSGVVLAEHPNEDGYMLGTLISGINKSHLLPKRGRRIIDRTQEVACAYV